MSTHRVTASSGSVGVAFSYWLPLHVDVVAADLVDQAIVEGLQRIDDIAGCLGRKRGDDDRRESFYSSDRTFDFIVAIAPLIAVASRPFKSKNITSQRGAPAELDRSINPVNAAANLPRSLVAAGLTHRTGHCQFEPSLWIRILEIAISRPETGPQNAAEFRPCFE